MLRKVTGVLQLVYGVKKRNCHKMILKNNCIITEKEVIIYDIWRKIKRDKKTFWFMTGTICGGS